MLHGNPPPSRPSGPNGERLHTARGRVRDTLGAIHNIEQLLKSIRVGPKALVSVIPDVHDSCGPLRAAFRELLGAIEASQPAAAGAIDAFAMPHIDDLERALARARAAQMNARERLLLETEITRIAGALDAARAMVELLEAALGGRVARVDLRELVGETFNRTESASAPRGPRVAATLTCRDPGHIQANPQVSMSLIAMAVRLVAARPGADGAQVTVSQSADGAPTATVQPGTGEGTPRHIAVLPLLGPLRECAEAAAQAMGARFDCSDDGSVQIAWAALED